MKPLNSGFISMVLVILGLSLACNLQETARSLAADTPVPPETPLASATRSGSMVRQWATGAIASSQYSDPDWSALQAVGEPDTPTCGDIVTAWASLGSHTVEWINLYYDTPIHVTQINIIQTYQPDQVVRVDLIDLRGEIVPLYTQEPRVVTESCPYTLSIKIPQTDFVVQGVRITVDQSVVGLGWNEIDAVELVGVPGRGEAVRPTVAASPSTTPFPPTSTPVPSTATPLPSAEGGVPLIRQWARDAVASSQYSDPDWSALQAAGEPDTPACGDIVTAWASLGSHTVEWINLYYDMPVHVTEINIIQTYNPDQVVRVDLIDVKDEIVQFYVQRPQVMEQPCPYRRSIKVKQTDFLVRGVRITVDQSVLGLGWNEIDAVELVGVPGQGQ